MNRSEFMEKLEEFLAELSPAERQEAIEYYNSYLDDAGIGNDDKVPESIGTPEEVAKQLKRSILNPDIDFMADEKVNYNAPKKSFEKKSNTNQGKRKISNGELAVIIIGVVLTSPIWFSLIVGVLSLIFGICMAVIGVLFGFFVAAICLVIVGICLGVAGISIMFTETAAGMGLIGAGCIVLALGIIAVVLIINCMVVFFPWLIRFIEKMIGKIKKNGGKKL